MQLSYHAEERWVEFFSLKKAGLKILYSIMIITAQKPMFPVERCIQ